MHVEWALAPQLVEGDMRSRAGCRSHFDHKAEQSFNDGQIVRLGQLQLNRCRHSPTTGTENPDSDLEPLRPFRRKLPRGDV